MIKLKVKMIKILKIKVINQKVEKEEESLKLINKTANYNPIYQIQTNNNKLKWRMINLMMIKKKSSRRMWTITMKWNKQ